MIRNEAYNFFLHHLMKEKSDVQLLIIQCASLHFLIEWNKCFISCIHRTFVHMQYCSYLCKYKDVFYIFGNWFFFLRGSIKFLGSGLKFWVGQVSGNTTFFCVALLNSIQVQKKNVQVQILIGFCRDYILGRKVSSPVFAKTH
jgi:hypothetical protein